MKTFKEFLIEEYYSIVKTWNNRSKHPVFLNPTKKEILEYSDDANVRFIIILDKKELYVFSFHVLHDSAARQLYLDIDNENMVKGEAEIVDNAKLKIVRIRNGDDSKFIKSPDRLKYFWLDKWFVNF